MYDALQTEIVGFLGGFSGLIENKFVKLSSKEIDPVRNQGGFDLIGSGRTKVETAEQLKAVAVHAKHLDAISFNCYDTDPRRVIGQYAALGKPLIINSEELATMFHFPGPVAGTPALERVPSKKAEAPSNLPV